MWSKGDVVILAIIFFLLGMLTSVLLYIFFIFPDEAKAPHEKGMSSYAAVPTHFQENSPVSPALPAATNNLYTDAQAYYLWESTTVIRSALYQFVKETGAMPGSLDELTGPYLSALPREPISFSNQVVEKTTGTGGWVYRPGKIVGTSEEQLMKAVEAALVPNVRKSGPLPFAPLNILIIRSSNELLLLSGETIIRSYTAGLGIHEQTPLGSFFIAKKVMNPNAAFFPPNESPFGKRGLEWSDSVYAIHGTNAPQSIGKNVSNGCVRLGNEDVTELYSMVPLFTDVMVVDGTDLKLGGLSEGAQHPFGEELLPMNLYEEEDRVEEQELERYFSWAG